MNRPTVPLHIPLKEAYLCANCSCIGNDQNRCSACASSVVHPLAAWLNRSAA
jgi:hypothetical protein